MRTIYQQHRFKSTPIILVLFLSLIFVGCSGYQPISYYQDGIYGEAPIQQIPQQAQNTTPAPQQSGTYYKNYFSEKAAQGIQDDYFISPEQYQSPTPDQTSAGNYQAHGSWGDQTDRININVNYNRPIGWNMGWGWYDAPYTFGRSSFWGYNYHPWYFTYGFNHHPFYNPYRFGWGYRGNYWNSWGYQNPYWDRRYYNRNVYGNAPIYNRLNGSRTITRNYTTNRSGRSINSAATNNRANARSATRTNANAQRSGSTTQQREGVSGRNQTTSRTTTRRSNSTNNRATTSQSQNNSSRNYSNNNSSYRSSSSSSNNSYRRSTPSSSTRSSSSSSSRSSSSSSRRR